MRHDNTALLSKFVTERGAILPRRFTKCCATHQRALARTVKRSRWLNLLPVHSKLHPRARFTALSPPTPGASANAGASAASAALAAGAARRGPSAASVLAGLDGGAPAARAGAPLA
jgi:ribosomal protein S18